MTDLQTVLNSLIEVARTITDLKRSILNAAEDLRQARLNRDQLREQTFSDMAAANFDFKDPGTGRVNQAWIDKCIDNALGDQLERIDQAIRNFEVQLELDRITLNRLENDFTLLKMVYRSVDTGQDLDAEALLYQSFDAEEEIPF